MNTDELNKLEAFARAATVGEWQWAQTPTRTRIGAAWWAIRAIFCNQSPSLWGVMVGSPDHLLWVAITGNGPDSEANSAYLIAVQPSNILLLIEQLRKH